METSAAPPRSRSNAVIVIVAVVLFLAGLAAGFLLWRPAPVSSPGPVDGLSRTDLIPLVDGWVNGTDVQYLDYGPMSNVAVPILVFFQAASPDTPVAGQRNIIDTIPGQPGYSDFWRVHKVLAPSGYAPNSIRSFEDAVASGYTIEPTDIIVNCPVVNPDARVQGSTSPPVDGWYRDRQVFYFDHGANSPGDGSVVRDAPIYVFFRSDGSMVPGQRNVIDVVPGDAGYSDLWRVMMVTVGATYVANTLRSMADIEAESAAGNVTIAMTDIYVNCPVV